MPLAARHLLMTYAALMLFTAPSGFAAAQSAPAPTISDKPAALAGTSALRVYDAMMMECFKQVMNVDPLDAAQKKDVASLNMDQKHLVRIQDCLRDKGVPANFENYFSGNNKSGLSAARRADLQAVQDGLSSGAAPAVTPDVQPAPAPAPLPQGSMTVIPAPRTPEGTSGDDNADEGQTTPAKAPRQTPKYWVTPE